MHQQNVHYPLSTLPTYVREQGIPQSGSFQNKSIGSSFKLVPEYILFLAKLRGEGRPFWSGQAQIDPLSYLLHVGILLTIIKMFIILCLLCLLEYGTHRQFSTQISKLSFQLSVPAWSFLDQSEGQRKAFFGGCKKGGHIVRLPRRALGCHKR